MHDVAVAPEALKVRRKNRLTLLALFLVFVGPVALAYLAVLGYGFTPGVTNKGELLTPPPNVGELQLSPIPGATPPLGTERRWRLMYVNGTDCAAACEHNLYTLHQVWTALGKDQERVAPLFVSLRPESLTGVVTTVKPAFAQLAWSQAPMPTPDLAARLHFDASATVGRLYIVDPQGAIPLTYELSSDAHESAAIGKRILKDLSHLLKWSNIG